MCWIIYKATEMTAASSDSATHIERQPIYCWCNHFRSFDTFIWIFIDTHKGSSVSRRESFKVVLSQHKCTHTVCFLCNLLAIFDRKTKRVIALLQCDPFLSKSIESPAQKQSNTIRIFRCYRLQFNFDSLQTSSSKSPNNDQRRKWNPPSECALHGNDFRHDFIGWFVRNKPNVHRHASDGQRLFRMETPWLLYFNWISMFSGSNTKWIASYDFDQKLHDVGDRCQGVGMFRWLRATFVLEPSSSLAEFPSMLAAGAIDVRSALVIQRIDVPIQSHRFRTIPTNGASDQICVDAVDVKGGEQTRWRLSKGEIKVNLIASCIKINGEWPLNVICIVLATLVFTSQFKYSIKVKEKEMIKFFSSDLFSYIFREFSLEKQCWRWHASKLPVSTCFWFIAIEF